MSQYVYSHATLLSN